jgi:iron complex transport system substrate-binding protein
LLMRMHRLAVIISLALLMALSVASLVGCGSASTTSARPQSPAIAVDALGNPISIPTKAPQRIISETPTDSEILAALGVDARVVAVDYYTDYPADLAAKPKITDGQTFTLNDEAILGYQPDLVVGYGGYFKPDEQKLIAAGVQVVDLPLVTTVQQSLTEVRLVGQIVHADAAAARQIAALQRRIDAVTHSVAGVRTPSVYMEDGTYNGQYSTFGQGSYGDDLIRLAGGSNIFASDGDSGGYPNVSAESIIQANPAYIITIEGTQFGGAPKDVAARPGWSVIAAVRDGHVYALDPNDFGRPDAPRLVSALEALAKTLHPDLFA